MKNANPVSCLVLFALAAGAALTGCTRSAADRPPSVPRIAASAAGNPAPVRFRCEVVATWPHDRGAFTQGLVFRNGGFLESTGLHGRSTLREVELKTGRVLKQVAVANAHFAEGLAVIGDRAFQLTWQSRIGFIYDADTFRRIGDFAYEGEGWGLATDGRSLILSDGTARIRFLDPATFQVTRTVEVTANGKPVDRLNELEWIEGELFANVWQTEEVLRIDPASGRVVGVIDCAGLLAPQERAPDTDVLNGIAYDPASGRLFLTGKHWPKVFEVRLVPAP